MGWCSGGGVADRRCFLSEPDETPERPPSGGVTRRQAIKRLGTGGVGLLGAGIVVGSVGTRRADGAATLLPDTHDGHRSGPEPSGRLSYESPVGSDAGPYAGAFAPPDVMSGSELDALTLPPARTSGTVEVEMTVVETRLAIGREHTVDAWTYNGNAPGPTMRATEGELIRVHFTNATGRDHNLHFHGRHSPLHDGWEPVPPGGEVVYEIEAGPAGVHPYHCHTMPIDVHISKGLYGTLIVDPKRARTEAHEVVLALTGWDIDNDGRNDIFTWNGVAGFYQKFPIKIPAGEPVRAYVLNLAEYEPVGSFHLHAETFKVYPAGIGNSPVFETDVITLGQMERAMLEFSLPERGRYMFHPHQHRMAHQGAMGWFAAI